MRGQIRNDERGAIMVMALFFAVFALALLYTVVGTAETIFFREHMQDAADAAALSAAVAHARSMNLLVLINIVMAALLAILVTLKLIEALAILGIVIATVLAWPTFGASLAAIPPLKTIQSEVSAAYDTAKPPVDTALEALHDTADAVKTAAPVVADAIALTSFEAWKPPVEIGFAAGSRLTGEDRGYGLPVEDDAFSELCGQAGEFPMTLANAALGELGIGPVFEPLQGPMHDMTEAFSEWFCGDGGTRPPTFQRTEERSHPRLSETVSCEEEDFKKEGAVDPGAQQGDVILSQAASATTPACEESQRVEAEARPDEDTGSCRAGTDCSAHGPYEQRVAQARVDCAPTGSPRPYAYRYQERRGKVDYLWTGKTWVRGTPEFAAPVLRGSDTPPCGPKQSHPLVAEGYNLIVRQSDDVSELLPVCTTETLPVVTVIPPAPGDLRTVEFIEVSHILDCKKREVIDVSVDDADSAGDGGSEKAPKRVEEGAALGDENFQVRALMKGSLASHEAARIVRLALWGAKDPESPLDHLRALGRFSVAQAEYFYDGTEGRGAYMWNMKWRARLVRFRLPEDGSESSEILSGACYAALGDVCAGLFELASKPGLFAH